MDTGEEMVLTLREEVRCFDAKEFTEVSGVSEDHALDLGIESAEVVSVTVIVESLRDGRKFELWKGEEGTCSGT